jgi:hypothetical protein
MKYRTLVCTVAASAAALMSACGGGADGGIGGTGTGQVGLSSGTITNFGSVWVNGVEFNSVGSTIRRDDDVIQSAQAGDDQTLLSRGMIARVDGSIVDKKATTITANSAIKGRVEAVTDANHWTVMGQTVQVDDQTVLKNGTPVTNNYIEVHGLPVSPGVIAAGYVEIKSTLAATPFVATGVVTAQVDTTLTIGTLTVNFASATTTDMPSGSWVGLIVRAKGSSCSGNPVCGTLTATQLEPGGLQVTAIDQAEIEGFVSGSTGSTFLLDGQSVAVTAGTRYENGVAGDVADGVKLEAEGAISGGVLTATKISFRDGIRIEADVLATAAGNITLTTLPGITVKVNSLTSLKGSAVVVGSHIRVRGRLGAGNSVIATELEGRSANKKVVLQGPVSAPIASPVLNILGVAIDTSTATSFTGFGGAPTSRVPFFSALIDGSSVKASGDQQNGIVTWSELEREN